MFRSNGRATSNGSDSASTSRPASMPSGPASTSVPTPYYMPYYFPAPFMMSGHASATNGAASGASPTEANNPNPPQALGNMMYYMPPPPGYAQGRQQTQQQHPGMQGGYFMVPTPGSSQGIHPSMVLDVRHSVASNTPTASGATKAQHQQQQQAFYAMAPPPAHYPIYGSPYSPQFMVPGHPHLAFGSSNSSCGSLPNSRPASPTLRENKASVKQESNGSSPTSSAMTSAGASAASMMNSTADTISTSTEVSNDSESTYPARTKRAQVKVACGMSLPCFFLYKSISHTNPTQSQSPL